MRLIRRGDRALAHYKKGSAVGRVDFETVIQEINELMQPDPSFQQLPVLVFEAVPTSGLET